MSGQLNDAIHKVKLLEGSLEVSDDISECDIEIRKGDWNGQLTLVSLSSSSAVHIARQLLQLVERDYNGAHFDIDKTNIATETDNQLCFVLRKES